MPNAIVTVRLSGSDQEYDLEVPAHVPAQQLAELITSNLTPGALTQQSFSVQCLKPEALTRKLRADESLAQAGLWDGAFLQIGPVGAVKADEWRQVLFEWEPFDTSLPSSVAELAQFDLAPGVGAVVEEPRTARVEWQGLGPLPANPVLEDDEPAAAKKADQPSPAVAEAFAVQWEPLGPVDPPPQQDDTEDEAATGDRVKEDDQEKPSPGTGYSWKKL